MIHHIPEVPDEERVRLWVRDIEVHTKAAQREVERGDYVMAQGHAIIAHKYTGHLLEIVTEHVPAPTEENPS